MVAIIAAITSAATTGLIEVAFSTQGRGCRGVLRLAAPGTSDRQTNGPPTVKMPRLPSYTAFS